MAENIGNAGQTLENIAKQINNTQPNGAPPIDIKKYAGEIEKLQEIGKDALNINGSPEDIEDAISIGDGIREIFIEIIDKRIAEIKELQKNTNVIVDYTEDLQLLEEKKKIIETSSIDSLYKDMQQGISHIENGTSGGMHHNGSMNPLIVNAINQGFYQEGGKYKSHRTRKQKKSRKN